MVAVFADIDRLKTVNNTFGHAVGDAVLIAVDQTLRRTCRASNLLARLGGEELFLVCVVNRHDAAPLAERLRRDITDADGKLAVTISVGAAWSMVAPR